MTPCELKPMTPRTDLLTRIYVPASMGAATLYHDFDPDIHLGVVFGIHSQKFRPIMSEEEGVVNREPVTAEIMRQVVDDAVCCPWRLERDGGKIHDHGNAIIHGVYVYENSVPRYLGAKWSGVRTYTDLIALVRLANG
jgi:hypothetical protein